jgi:hypothetical protein
MQQLLPETPHGPRRALLTLMVGAGIALGAAVAAPPAPGGAASLQISLDQTTLVVTGQGATPGGTVALQVGTSYPPYVANLTAVPATIRKCSPLHCYTVPNPAAGTFSYAIPGAILCSFPNVGLPQPVVAYDYGSTPTQSSNVVSIEPPYCIG